MYVYAYAVSEYLEMAVVLRWLPGDVDTGQVDD